MENKKKILFVITQAELGGAQIYVRDLADGLKNDYNVSVIFGGTSENNFLSNELKKINIKSKILPQLKRNISPINDIFTIFKLRKLIKNLSVPW